jgi:hypothetical protein
MGKIYFQLPKFDAANMEITGPKKAATALINCPKVRLLVSFSALTTFDNNGFIDT